MRVQRRFEQFAGVLLLTLVAGCKRQAPASGADDAQRADKGVETAVVHPEQSTDFLDVPAHVMGDPSKTVRIYPPLSGRILGLRVLPGQEVHKGDVIAMLQSGEVASARADFEKSKIEMLRADRALTRAKLLRDHDVLSQADFYEVEATDQVAHSSLEQSRQRIRELGFAEDGVTDTVAIRSPIAGAVLEIGTATGEMQRSLDNANTIATIANLDSVWVSGDVFERDLSALRNGRQVDVLVPAYPDLKLNGKIANISDAMDPGTHTLKLRVVLPNAQHLLKPDMFATIRVSEATRSAFVVPETAVLHDGEKTSVYLAAPDHKFVERPVQVGRTFSRGATRSVEVLSGLNDGDRIVTVGGALLRPTAGE